MSTQNTPAPRTLGRHTVSPLGLGAMPLSMGRGEAKSQDVARAVVAAALEAGITLIDTADIYAPSWDTMGHNEKAVAEALAAYAAEHPDIDRSAITVATKGGITRAEGERWGRNSEAAYLRDAAERSRDNLGVDSLDLYYLHRPDRTRVYREAMETLAALKQDGIVTEVGISNASVEEIEIAIDVLGEGGLAAVQNEFSPRFNHTSYDELTFCGEHNIAFVPWSPLGGTGGGAQAVGEKFPSIARVAESHGVSAQQVTLAWELALADHVVPIPGASKPESIADSALAMHLELSAEEREALNAELLPKR